MPLPDKGKHWISRHIGCSVNTSFSRGLIACCCGFNRVGSPYSAMNDRCGRGVEAVFYRPHVQGFAHPMCNQPNIERNSKRVRSSGANTTFSHHLPYLSYKLSFFSKIHSQNKLIFCKPKSQSHQPLAAAQPIRGFYGSGRDPRAPCRLLLLGESFYSDSDKQHGAGPGARFEECRAIGVVKNVNTKEASLLCQSIAILPLFRTRDNVIPFFSSS